MVRNCTVVRLSLVVFISSSCCYASNPELQNPMLKQIFELNESINRLETQYQNLLPEFQKGQPLLPTLEKIAQVKVERANELNELLQQLGPDQLMEEHNQIARRIGELTEEINSLDREYAAVQPAKGWFGGRRQVRESQEVINTMKQQKNNELAQLMNQAEEIVKLTETLEKLKGQLPVESWESKLDRLVREGLITQEQANEQKLTIECPIALSPWMIQRKNLLRIAVMYSIRNALRTG